MRKLAALTPAPSLMVLLAAALILLLTACEKAEPDPTPTPDREGSDTAATLFAQPTRTPVITPTVTPVPEVELELNRLVASMEVAVLNQDYDAYMSHIWDGDPVWYTEHSRWARDWVEHPLSVFDISLFGIRSGDDGSAVARMSVQWSQVERAESGSSGGATASMVFYPTDDGWLLGGEEWTTATGDGFRLHYFDNEVIENADEAQMMLDYLPGIITVLTREFEVELAAPIDIRLYSNPATLQTFTRMSIPPVLDLWNEPGEGIKVALNENGLPPREPVMAGHIARHLLYVMGDESHGNFPWWLEDGLAAYGESRFLPLSQRNRVVRTVAALTLAAPDADERLRAWDAMQTEPDWFESDLLLASDQAYTFVVYVTDTYGVEARNAWAKAIATAMTVDEASVAHFDATFDELDAGWRAWLSEQLN